MSKMFSCRRGFEPRATGFSYQCSNLRVKMTLDFQDLFTFILLSSTTSCSLVLNRPPIMSRHLLSTRLQQGVLLNSIKVKCEGLGS